VSYTLQYGQVAPYLPYLAAGGLISLALAFLAFAGGMLLGLLGAIGLGFGPRPVRGAIRAYVVFFTNTPQLVQIYFLFFVLPDGGILLSPFQAVLLGMTLNAGAYLTEIQRAGFASVPRGELDAAETLGMSLAQCVRHVILPHVVRTLYAPLSNQYIVMVLGTSMAAVFGVEELTGRAFSVNAQTFRSIEVFSVVGVLYLLVTLVATLALAIVGRLWFRVRLRVL
jgi:polar amino acid transport system permease protein